MANIRKDMERLQIRIPRRIADVMRAEVERRELANLQALITSLCEEFVDQNRQNDTAKAASQPEIDLRTLLIEAHRANAEANKTIAKLSDTIATLSEERKNAPAEPAVIAPASASTAKRTGGQVRVIR